MSSIADSSGGRAHGLSVQNRTDLPDTLLWLVYRTFGLRAPLRLTWRQLYHQFDSAPSRPAEKRAVQKFRLKMVRELKKIKLAWKDLNYATAPGLLILHPSTPTIAPYRPSLRQINAS